MAVLATNPPVLAPVGWRDALRPRFLPAVKSSLRSPTPHRRWPQIACTLALAAAITALPAQTTIDNTVTPTLGAFDTSVTNLTLSGTATGTASGVISGSGSLTQSGSGTWTLSAANTLAGPTTVSAGTLSFTGSGGLASSAVTVDSGATLFAGNYSSYNIGSIAGAGAVVFSFGTLYAGGNNASTTFSGSIAGSGTLVKTGTGTLTFNGSAPSGGQLAVSGGTLHFAPSPAADFTAPVLVQSGGTAIIAPPDPSRFVRHVSVSSGGSATIALPNSTPLSTTDITVSSGGALTLGETYKATALSNTKLDVSSGAILSLPGEGLVLGGLSNFGGGAITIAPTGFWVVPNLRIGANNLSSYFGGTLTFTGSSFTPQIIKIGTGTWTLLSTPNFAPVVQAGYVALSNDSAGTGIQLQGGGVRFDAAMTHTGGIVGQTGGGTINLGSNHVTLSGGLAGGSSSAGDTLNKIGSGTLTLTGSSTSFLGNLAINAGTLHLASALANGTVTLGSGTSLTLGHNSSYAVGGLSGSGSVAFSNYGGGGYGNFQQLYVGGNDASSTFSGNLTSTADLSTSTTLSKTGSGTLTVTGASAPGIRLSVEEGSLTLAPVNPAALQGTAIALGDSFLGTTGTLVIAPPTSTPLGLSAINVNSGGVLQVSTQPTTALSGTTVRFYGGNAALNDGTVLGGIDGFNDATLTTAASYSGGGPTTSATIAFGANNQSTSYYGTLRAGDNVGLMLQKVGTGTWTFEGNLDSYSTLEIQAGTVNFLAPNTRVTLAGGTLSYGSAMTHNRELNVSSASTVDTPYDITLNGSLNGMAQLTKTGSGTLSFSGFNTGFNSTASFNVTAGALALSDEFQLGYSTTLTLNGGTLRATQSFTGTQATTLGSNGGTFDVAGSDRALTWNGALTGSGTFTKAGAGTLALNAANTYAGGTTISFGTVTTGHATALGTGPVTVSGATAILALNGNLLANAVHLTNSGTLSGSGSVGALSAGGRISPGASPGTLAAGTTTFAPGGSYLWEINDAASPATSAGTRYDLLSITGALNITATSDNPFTIHLTSLLADNTAGAVINFNSSLNSHYTIASASSGITGFSASAFTLDTAGFTNALNGGTWSIGRSGNDLNLTFTSAIPEPSTYAALLGALSLAVAWRRRVALAAYRKKRRTSP